MRTIFGAPFYIINQYERGIVEFLGKYQRFVSPGLHFQLPFLELTRIRDIREHTLDIAPQPVITKDNVEIRVDGLIWVRPGFEAEEIQKTFYCIDNWKRAVLELAMTNLRQEFGGLTLDESLVAREKISANLRKNLDDMTKDWGLKVCKVEIKLIDPPNDIKLAMHKQKTAEQERRAMRLLATGKFEAAEQYFKGNAQELKRLEVTESSLKNNSKIILTEGGISPTILIGELPLSEASRINNQSWPSHTIDAETAKDREQSSSSLAMTSFNAPHIP